MSDEGGGFALSTLDNAFRYSFTTAKKPRTSLADPASGPDPHQSGGDPPLAGYGYGLPLSRLYARYFGGDLVLAPYAVSLFIEILIAYISLSFRENHRINITRTNK